jgi:hypothetical protein
MTPTFRKVSKLTLDKSMFVKVNKYFSLDENEMKAKTFILQQFNTGQGV